ncbi:MAG: hypothetical protein NTW11_00205 [Candidatus Staskawiczbacteria bacterium]|nr:hypothetical protein [Candidatus Staskawiczbacteria bacterium]
MKAIACILLILCVIILGVFTCIQRDKIEVLCQVNSDLELRLKEADKKAENAERRQQTAEWREQSAIARAKQLVDRLNAEKKPKEPVPQTPVKEAVAIKVPNTVPLINVLFINEHGQTTECYKGVRTADIVRNGRHTQMKVEGKTINWNYGVMFSYPYTSDGVPIIGAICYKGAGVLAEVINVPSYNVYTDNDGNIRYDLSGKYLLAPKGSGYVTEQSYQLNRRDEQVSNTTNKREGVSQ